MRPRPNRTLPANFSELPSGHFEEMTRALHSNEPDIKSARLYKTQRQRQFGIDVLAECRDGRVEVSSCKCYGKLAKGEIATFSDDFLEHWESHWKDKGVRRFILTSAAYVHSDQREAEVKEQKRRFAEYGITYEVWAPH